MRRRCGPGRILPVSRLRMNTHRVTAVLQPRPALGNTWWSFLESGLTAGHSKALVLWLNSTLGVPGYYGRRAITEGAWVQMKKPAWSSMPVLDVRRLDSEALHRTGAAYDEVPALELAPIAQLDRDMNRRRIDTLLESVLGLPGVQPLRELLARAPGLTARPITRRAKA